MSKEMLFLCDVFDKWLDENNLPHRVRMTFFMEKMPVNLQVIKNTG